MTAHGLSWYYVDIISPLVLDRLDSYEIARKISLLYEPTVSGYYP